LVCFLYLLQVKGKMDINNNLNKTKLKRGFTTGTCSAACAKASWLLLSGKIFSQTISVLFPDKIKRNISIHEYSLLNRIAKVSTIKDAGSDPDVTHKALIECTMKESDILELNEHDYFFRISHSSLILRGGDGVGLVTRDGLAPLKNKWAINPIPQQMIIDNLIDSGFGSENKIYIFEIRVENGEILAKKTLNTLLGIKGGISILGTTGIVEPYSNSAYVETIKILIKSLKRDNVNHIIFTTGSQSRKAAQQVYPEQPEESFIRIGDFISKSLEFAEVNNINKISIACMPGKLFKYANGNKNTHAHSASILIGNIVAFATKAGIGLTSKEINKIQNCVTVREALKLLPDELVYKNIECWISMALSHFRGWVPNINIEIMVFDYNGILIVRK